MSASNPPHKRKRRRGNDPPSASTTTEEEEISERVAPDGDVIFVLSGGTKKVQVQSSIMKSASPVFSTMLAGPFKEGQMLQEAVSTGQPVEISLPGDDFEAFKLVCVAVHRQNNTKQHAPDAQTIMQVFEVADKYNLVDSVSLSIEFWARRYMDAHRTMAGDFPLMTICHQIGSQELFQLSSRSLVLGHRGSFLTLAAASEPKICGSVPRERIYKLACSLEEMRATMMRRITTFINAEMVQRLRRAPSDISPVSSIIPYYRLLLGTLDSYSRDPGLHTVGYDHSINDLMAQISGVESCCLAVDDGDSGSAKAAANEIYRALVRRLRGLKENFAGLCLKCLEANKLDFDCRGIHE